MKEYLKINLNDAVKVKLTERGKDIFFHQFDNLNKESRKQIIKPHMPEIDDDGYSTFQLWCLMNLYGQHIRMGMELVFETNIIVMQEKGGSQS